jgi:hypothetical protein
VVDINLANLMTEPERELFPTGGVISGMPCWCSDAATARDRGSRGLWSSRAAVEDDSVWSVEGAA